MNIREYCDHDLAGFTELMNMWKDVIKNKTSEKLG